MKQKIINQEILLITGTNFSNRLFSRSNADHNSDKGYSAIEELERACWDGILTELLPELACDSSNGDRNFIWNIVTGDHFLCISMGLCPMPGKNETSIDPHFFPGSVLYN
jgi:hypothetical protein